jgi:hypothetical protein
MQHKNMKICVDEKQPNARKLWYRLTINRSVFELFSGSVGDTSGLTGKDVKRQIKSKNKLILECCLFDVNKKKIGKDLNKMALNNGCQLWKTR